MGKNNTKFTNEEIDNILFQYNYIRLEEYINNRTPIKCEHILTKYRYMIRTDNIKTFKPSLWKLSNECNFDYNIKLYLNNNYPNIKYIGYKKITKSKKKNTLVSLECSCGNCFNVILTKMVNGYYKTIECNDCKVKHNIRGLKKGTKKNLEIIENHGYKILNKEYYLKQTINFTTKVDVEDEYGFKGSVSANLCTKAKHFATFSIRQNREFFIDNVNLLFKQNSCHTKCIGIIDIDNVLCICECGKNIQLSVYQIKGRKYRCDNCTNRYSSLETKVKNYLSENNIEFIMQYKFNDCKDKLPLPFDFYLPQQNTCIETDGKQHYKICFGNEADFHKTKEHDNIKNEYCKNKNINLIRIPYYEFDNDNWKNYLIHLN